MDIILWSTLLVALAEIGDKTMLLAILLSARFRRPLPIIAGIFVSTIVNHAFAAWAGSAIAGLQKLTVVGITRTSAADLANE